MGGVEDGEESQQMGDIIQRNTIDAHHIVCVVAALHVKSRVVLGVSLYARQQLGVVHRVGIAEDMGHIVHHTQVYEC